MVARSVDQMPFDVGEAVPLLEEGSPLRGGVNANDQSPLSPRELILRRAAIASLSATMRRAAPRNS